MFSICKDEESFHILQTFKCFYSIDFFIESKHIIILLIIQYYKVKIDEKVCYYQNIHDICIQIKTTNAKQRAGNNTYRREIWR